MAAIKVAMMRDHGRFVIMFITKFANFIFFVVLHEIRLVTIGRRVTFVLLLVAEVGVSLFEILRFMILSGHLRVTFSAMRRGIYFTVRRRGRMDFRFRLVRRNRFSTLTTRGMFCGTGATGV